MAVHRERGGLNIAAHSGLFGDGMGEFWMAPRFAYTGICNAVSANRVDVLRGHRHGSADHHRRTARSVTAAIKADVPGHDPDHDPRTAGLPGCGSARCSDVAFEPMGSVYQASDRLPRHAQVPGRSLRERPDRPGVVHRQRRAAQAGLQRGPGGDGERLRRIRRCRDAIGAFMAEHGITAEDYEAANEVGSGRQGIRGPLPRDHRLPGSDHGRARRRTWSPGASAAPAAASRTAGLSVSTSVSDVDAAMRLLNWIYQPDASGHHTGELGQAGSRLGLRRGRPRPRAAHQGSRLTSARPPS